MPGAHVAAEVVLVAGAVVAEGAGELGRDAALVVHVVAQRGQELVGAAATRAHVRLRRGRIRRARASPRSSSSDGRRGRGQAGGRGRGRRRSAETPPRRGIIQAVSLPVATSRGRHSQPICKQRTNRCHHVSLQGRGDGVWETGNGTE